MKKRLVLLLSAIVCVVSLCSGLAYKHNVCYAAEEAEITGSVPNQEDVIRLMDDWYYLWNDTDFELQRAQSEIKGGIGEDYTLLCEEWAALKKEVGEADRIIKYELKEDESGNIHITAIAKYEKGALKFSINFNQDLVMLDYYPTIKKYEMTEEKASLTKAGVNTIMSITIVFLVLVFIAFIISLLKYVPRLFGLEKKEEKKEDKVPEVPASAVEEDVADDTELVAVITAAIMASMGDQAPADGLRISSIKRRTNSKWKTR